MTSTNQKTKAPDIIGTNGDYTKFLLSVAASLQDLSERIRAELIKTKPGELENIELMCLDTYTAFMSLALNLSIGRSMSKSMVTQGTKNDMPAAKMRARSPASKNATGSTSKRTGSHSSNSPGGQTKNSPKR